MMEHDENSEDDRAGVSREGSDPLSEEERRVWDLERFDELPRCIGMKPLAELLGISKSACYELRKDGTIRAKKLGGRWIVPRHELFKLLTSPPEAA